MKIKLSAYEKEEILISIYSFIPCDTDGIATEKISFDDHKNKSYILLFGLFSENEYSVFKDYSEILEYFKERFIKWSEYFDEQSY